MAKLAEGYFSNTGIGGRYNYGFDGNAEVSPNGSGWDVFTPVDGDYVGVVISLVNPEGMTLDRLRPTVTTVADFDATSILFYGVTIDQPVATLRIEWFAVAIPAFYLAVEIIREE